jgi:hypothetical protein
MKSRILGLLAVGLLAGPMTSSALVISISGQGSADAVASRVETVEDQSNLDVYNTSFSGFGPWQQEVLVGVTGLLSGLEITFERLDASAGTLAIWTGSPWQTTAPLLSATYSDAKGATHFDLSAGGLYLSAGDRFTFGLIGTSGAIRGSYTDQPGGSYPGDLYTDDPSGGCYVDCGYDLGFRTFMVVSVSDPDPVPEPGSLALLGLGLAGLGLSRRRIAA